MPRPTADEQAARHDKAEYFEHPYFSNRRGAQAVAAARWRAAFKRIGQALTLDDLRNERMLDVGCDTGEFLKAATQHAGIVPVGIDVSGRAVEEARAAGIEAHHADLTAAPEHVSNLLLITAIDLIEHVVDPGAFLREARTRLRQGGVLYVETPNIASVVYQTGRIIAATTASRSSPLIDRLFPAEHLEYFNRHSLTALARDNQFDVLHSESRVLPAGEIAVSPAIRMGLSLLQLIDRARSTGILLCLLLRRS